MHIESDARNGTLLISVKESRIDAAGSVAFKERVRALVHDFDGRVIVDLAQVGFLDSSGLGALVAIMKMLGGRRLELAACGLAVSKVLKLTRMDRVFVLHDAVPPEFKGDRDAA